MREKGACSRRRALQSRNRKTGALPLWSYCDNLSPTSSTISQPIECTGQTPRRTHSCVQRAHSCVRDMFHCFLTRFPLQSREPPRTVKHPVLVAKKRRCRQSIVSARPAANWPSLLHRDKLLYHVDKTSGRVFRTTSGAAEQDLDLHTVFGCADCALVWCMNYAPWYCSSLTERVRVPCRPRAGAGGLNSGSIRTVPVK